jgi:transcriptional regulator with XRE-family HTH domain
VSTKSGRCEDIDIFATLDEHRKTVYRNGSALSKAKMRTIQYLNAVKSRYGLTSDYQLAAKLGLTRQNVSKMQANKGFMGEDTAQFIAQLLDIEPAIVVSHANAERARRAGHQTLLEMWLGIAAKFGAPPQPA